MARNEDGEFELMVGNKQLLSIVFILMVLFGVVFSMGYFVGRSGTAQEPATQEPVAGASGRARPDAAGTPTVTKPARGDTGLTPGESKVATDDAAPPSGTTPVSSPAEAQPAPAETVPAAQPQSKPPVPVPAEPARKSEPLGASAGEPEPGQTYLQVWAGKRQQAEMLVEVLKEKGFHATMATVNVKGEQMFCTLVGPVKGATEVAKTKADLEGSGFKPFVKKY